jgi:hypothetical protein
MSRSVPGAGADGCLVRPSVETRRMLRARIPAPRLTRSVPRSTDRSAWPQPHPIVESWEPGQPQMNCARRSGTGPAPRARPRGIGAERTSPGGCGEGERAAALGVWPLLVAVIPGECQESVGPGLPELGAFTDRALRCTWSCGRRGLLGSSTIQLAPGLVQHGDEGRDVRSGCW